MTITRLQPLLSALSVGDIAHNDLDRRAPFKERPCAPSFDGDCCSIEPDDRQFNERRFLPLPVLRDEVPDPVPGLRVEDI